MARGHSEKLGQLRCVRVEPGGGNLSVACNFFKYLLVFFFCLFVLFCFFFFLSFVSFVGLHLFPTKNSNISLYLKGETSDWQLVLSADTGAPPEPQISFIPHTHTDHTHTHTSAPLSFLDFIVDVPDVSLQGVGTALQVPGGQGQLGVELFHVGGLGDGCQRVGATAQQEVTEGRLDGGDVRRKERVLDLESCRKKKKKKRLWCTWGMLSKTRRCKLVEKVGEKTKNTWKNNRSHGAAGYYWLGFISQF